MSELPEFGLKDEYRTSHFPIEHVRARKGPSRWDEVKNDRDAYGRDFDFRILDENVFMPTCVAAQQWVYEHFPETCRYFCDLDEWVGVVVERDMDKVLEKAEKDGLIDEEVYEMMMLNEEWEQQNG